MDAMRLTRRPLWPSLHTSPAAGSSARSLRIRSAPRRCPRLLGLHRRTVVAEAEPKQAAAQPDQTVIVEELHPKRMSRIQVERQSFIDVRKGEMVDTLQERDDEMGREDWGELRKALRCLESIYRVEYLLVGDAALQSLLRINAATIVPDGVQLVRSIDEKEGDVDDSTDEWLDESRPDDWNLPGIPRVRYELDEAFLDTDPIFLSPAEYHEEEEIFLDIFVKLINRAHFEAVSARDSAIADTLNSSYLGQCFIRPDGKKVDDSFASHLIENTLREELGCVAVFKRGWGRQHKTGRLLVPKLDFMQRSVAKTLVRSVGLVISTTARVVGLRKTPNKKDRPEEQQEDSSAAGLGSSDSRLSRDSDEFTAANEGSQAADQAANKGSQERSEGEQKGKPEEKPGEIPASYLGSSDSYLSRDSGEFLLDDIKRQVSDQVGKDASLRTAVVQTRAKGAMEKLGDRIWQLLWDIRVGLAYYGLLPPVISYTLEEFKDKWPVAESRRHTPVYIERTSIEDALGGDSMFQVLREGVNLFGKIELVEPTFREMVVLCREKSNPGQMKKLQMSYVDRVLIFLKLRPKPREPLTQEQLHMRVYRDIPVPLWRIIYPFKALAFRPLDIIKVDLVAIAGLVAIIAQVKFGNAWLQLVWISSVLFQMYRVFSRYRKMFVSFENFVSKTMLAKTVAGQEGVIDVLSQSAALQQYKMAVLLYYTLLLDGTELLDDQEHAALRIEHILEEMECHVNFEVREAQEELIRLGLIKYEYRDGRTEKQLVRPDEAVQVLKDHWGMILKRQLREPGEMHATFEEVMATNVDEELADSSAEEWTPGVASDDTSAASTGGPEAKDPAELMSDESIIIQGAHRWTSSPEEGGSDNSIPQTDEGNEATLSQGQHSEDKSIAGPQNGAPRNGSPVRTSNEAETAVGTAETTKESMDDQECFDGTEHSVVPGNKSVVRDSEHHF